ncbi:hypothetical protein C8J56DRAFT_924950 [Mycena floridula]|nr:hypothetical protein C8J56DRAFT_924950 [Mycena floridula]
MAKPSLVDICSILSQSPTLLQQLTIDDVLTFIRLTAGLKNDILFGQKPSHNPETIPQELPQNVLSFLSSTMNLSSEHIHYLWDAFRVTIWTENHCPKEQAAQDRARFHENSESELMLHALYPPVHFCVHADCPSKTDIECRAGIALAELGMSVIGGGFHDSEDHPWAKGMPPEVEKAISNGLYICFSILHRLQVPPSSHPPQRSAFAMAA